MFENYPVESMIELAGYYCSLKVFLSVDSSSLIILIAGDFFFIDDYFPEYGDYSYFFNVCFLIIRSGFLKKSPSSSLFNGTVPIRFSLKPGCGFKRRVVLGDSVIIDDLYCLILMPGEYIRIGTCSRISL